MVRLRSPVRQSIQLGPVQETALVPLYARALESRRKRPILEDAKAAEIVDSIDWDFRRFGQRRKVVGCTLRSAMFDVWVQDFLRRHPEGSVVEIGAGLNTRFERLDNGRVHWYDLELPEMVELRRKFFCDSERRITLAASVLDPDWIETVRRSRGPYFLVAETVFAYLEEAQVKAALGRIASGFPEVTIALDTLGRRAVDIGNRGFARQKMAARFTWACEDPIAIQHWNIGLRLVESRTVADVPECLWPRLSLPLRANLRLFGRFFPKQMKMYQLNVFAGRWGC
ncbi:MAG: class I SAM-dependent methyltransferase [Acidobacteriia bacterium]|nr:class I SAM-dependent methyltransferase [Terriglobia bacterium]